MPPKVEILKEQNDTQMESSTEADSSKIKGKPAKEQENPQLGCSSAKMGLKAEKPPPTKEDIVQSPVCRIASDSIVEMIVEDDPVVSEVIKMQKARVPFEKILLFHLGNRRFTDDQRKSWLFKINSIRPDRSLSSISTDYETEASKEVAHLKFSEEEISNICDRLEKDNYWDFTGSKEKIRTESKTETSSDSEIEMTESEMKSPRQALRRSPRHIGTPKRPSWKEFKKGKNFESAYFKRKVAHSGVKKVIKKIVKAIWRKKKQQYIKKKEYSSIEVAKNEVQDLLFEAVGFMERRYLGQIKAAARQIYPSDYDIFERECESGTYDSQDDLLPKNETIRSSRNKMSVSVPTSTQQEHGLLDILIATLPMTLNDTDANETMEFVEILKTARNHVPEHISIKNVPTKSKSEKEMKLIGGCTVVCTALVEPPPDLERLARTGAKGYLKQIPTQDDEKSETKSVSNGTKDCLQLEPKENESESSIKLDTAEASGDIKFIDESSAEETEDLLSQDASEQFKREHSPKSPNTPSKKKIPEQ